MWRLVDFPFVRHDQQQAPTRRQRPRQLPQDAMRLAHMLQSHDVDARREGAVAKRQRREIGDGVEIAIVPGRVADGQIHAAVAGLREKSGVAALA